jgi:hypothetical protein
MWSQADVAKTKSEMLELVNSFYEANGSELLNVLTYYHSDESDKAGFEVSLVRDIAPLVDFIGQRAQAAMVLMNGELLWDAEIILRPMIEVLAKLYYIILSDTNEELSRKIKEYWEITKLFEKKKFSDRAKEIIKADIGPKALYLKMILTDSEEQDLISNVDYGNREYRKDILRKWSFSEIIKAIGDKAKDISIIPVVQLHYYYKLASHLSHGDQVAVEIIIERETREGIRGSLTELGHIAKIGRVVNEILIQSICLIHLSATDLNAIQKWVEQYNPVQKLVEEKHLAITAELRKVYGYESTDDEAVI